MNIALIFGKYLRLFVYTTLQLFMAGVLIVALADRLRRESDVNTFSDNELAIRFAVTPLAAAAAGCLGLLLCLLVYEAIRSERPTQSDVPT
ncbi:hypothetical protein ANRL2_00981 [Anaerolineae bacterium]|nr:hypothetical protein ANRL2_00981 [Anaerolineae bacterium]